MVQYVVTMSIEQKTVYETISYQPLTAAIDGKNEDRLVDIVRDASRQDSLHAQWLEVAAVQCQTRDMFTSQKTVLARMGDYPSATDYGDKLEDKRHFYLSSFDQHLSKIDPLDGSRASADSGLIMRCNRMAYLLGLKPERLLGVVTHLGKQPAAHSPNSPEAVVDFGRDTAAMHAEMFGRVCVLGDEVAKFDKAADIMINDLERSTYKVMNVGPYAGHIARRGH